MQPNQTPSEQSAVLACIDPDAYTAATYTTGWVALAEWDYVQAIIMAGDLGSSATLDAKLTAATDSSGTGPVDVTGAAITQLTQAGTDSNKQALINLRMDTLAGQGFTHIQLSMTVGTATSDAGALLMGFGPKYSPASNSDAATVDSIATV
jgi:hypothetical protein